MFKIGQPVIFYQRRKENPLGDKVYTAVITDIQLNLRRERTMCKLYRCNMNDLDVSEYEEAVKNKLGIYKRINFLLPYNPTLYKNILEWLWQVSYLITEKVYDLFPITLSQTAPLIDKIKEMDGKQLKEESKQAIGFDINKPINSLDFQRGYKKINYKVISHGYKNYQKFKKT